MKTGDAVFNVIYFKLFYIIYAAKVVNNVHTIGQTSASTPFESIDRFVTEHVYPIYSDVEVNLER